MKPFIEPRPVVMALLSQVSTAERQLVALRTYSEAQAYVRRAQQSTVAAASALVRAESAIVDARVAEKRALVAEKSARSQAHLYRTALYELGMAEYTGQAATGGTDLASQMRQIDFSQLSDVAATVGGTGLERSQRRLDAAKRQVRTEREDITADLRAKRRARAVLLTARARVKTSQRALLVARTWASVPGAAPAQPAQALLSLESVGKAGKVRTPAGKRRGAKQVLVAGRLQASRSDTSSSASSTTSAAKRRSTSAPRRDTAAQGAGDEWMPADAGGPSILGQSLLSASEIEGWFESTGERANTTVPITKLARDYLEAAKLTGVRGDIAFAQSVVETGYFSFPSDGKDAANYNNFAGIGACSSCKHGSKFPSAMLGVITQESLLSEYAEPPPLNGPPGGLDAGLGVAGCCRTWMALSGVWASNPNYGYDILLVYQEMVNWAIGNELQETGLLPAWANSKKVLRG